MKRKYTASCFTIDFKNHSVLLMYNLKLNMWLQPGGHINDDNLELPSDAAIRETKEETGIDIKLIGDDYNLGSIQPVFVEHYPNNVGDMIDFQFVGVPVTTEIISEEEKEVIWQDIFTIEFNNEIDKEIKEKAKKLYLKYNR